MLQAQDAQLQEAPPHIIVEVLHRQLAVIPPKAVAAVLIRLYRVILLPVVILRVAVAVHAAIPAVVAVVLPVRPAVAAVPQEEGRYSIK